MSEFGYDDMRTDVKKIEFIEDLRAQKRLGNSSLSLAKFPMNSENFIFEQWEEKNPWPNSLRSWTDLSASRRSFSQINPVAYGWTTLRVETRVKLDSQKVQLICLIPFKFNFHLNPWKNFFEEPNYLQENVLKNFSNNFSLLSTFELTCG